MTQRSNPALSKPVNRKSPSKAALLNRTSAQRIPSRSGACAPIKAEYICADHPVNFHFRLRQSGGPYIPVCPVTHQQSQNRLSGKLDSTSALAIGHQLTPQEPRLDGKRGRISALVFQLVARIASAVPGGRSLWMYPQQGRRARRQMRRLS